MVLGQRMSKRLLPLTLADVLNVGGNAEGGQTSSPSKMGIPLEGADGRPWPCIALKVMDFVQGERPNRIQCLQLRIQKLQ